MKSPRKLRSAQVPAQFLGYSLQTTRATIRLLQAEPGSFVSVEVFEDVGLTKPGTNTIAEQSKSATASNPIADKSVELWKTLANWVRAAEAGDLDSTRTSFELFVSKERPGVLARTFAAASDENSARHALREARDLLWGAAPKYSKRSKVAPL